ncbi:hypothetical protein [Nocardia salmonicida]|uniref:hypothetical protein n=1 Tax=Nocardia salmonicida TaxID=53431 RepID=UPI001C3FCEB4|nr:hypothetical protein [Nocardia salmonicida]
MTKREHLPGVLEGMRAAGALSRLTVREIPDGSRCDHARCRRRRGEPVRRRPATTPPSIPQINSAALGPMLTLAKVMEQNPALNCSGIGVYREPGSTLAQHRAALEEERRALTNHEAAIMNIAALLRDNIRPIKSTPIGSYDMKHVVQRAIGSYVSNGDLIAAALIAKYPYRHIDGPNVELGMSQRDVNRLRNVRPRT